MAHVHGAAAHSKIMSHAAMAAHKGGVVSHGAHAAMAAGTVAAASTHSGRGFLAGLAKHPLLIFSAGLVVGFYAHKYRKEIIESAQQVSEIGKDFVLQQKENLEDLVAGSGSQEA
jgi:hypothetical protein